jgi:hypothetical protein
MKPIRYVLFIAILLLVSTACTTIGTEYFHLTRNDLCLTISTRNFWEPGTTADDLHNHLLSNVVVTLDGMVIQNDLMAWLGPAILIGIVDEEGNAVGTYGGSITGCLERQRTSEIISLLEVKTSMLSGIEKSQKWLLVFDDVFPLYFYFDEPDIERFTKP